MEGSHAAYQQCEDWSEEDFAGGFDGHEPGERWHHQIHREVRENVPVDLIEFGEPGGPAGVGQDSSWPCGGGNRQRGIDQDDRAKPMRAMQRERTGAERSGVCRGRDASPEKNVPPLVTKKRGNARIRP